MIYIHIISDDLSGHNSIHPISRQTILSFIRLVVSKKSISLLNKDIILIFQMEMVDQLRSKWNMTDPHIKPKKVIIIIIIT
jgi:hypothetical protein